MYFKYVKVSTMYFECLIIKKKKNGTNNKKIINLNLYIYNNLNNFLKYLNKYI